MLTTEAANYKVPKPKATEEINHCINQLKDCFSNLIFRLKNILYNKIHSQIILGAINEEDDRKMIELENFAIKPLNST